LLHDLELLVHRVTIYENQSMSDSIEEFGRRVQRCYGCFVAFHLKDMYLGADVTFFCEHCKDESMFHFADFSKLIDPSKLNLPDEGHHH
jgi:hypothetical protein